ncbi:hypothetical protein XA68_18065 [Ophiocordyceps unilateralis]|uniref:Membrane insertase YidC/Oxa/ALB C-terminal domain-containing protein n=1 Tax=Ophiocordyceps unilateralis TaxID=268505 RepID=A0A2A9PJV0_OPHUN|nr:hypothetical protein XA68_18065 [Ophiocordyceps unilateralis]
MLPNRGVVRVFSSVGPSRLVPGRHTSAATSSPGRYFGTLRQSGLSSSPYRPRRLVIASFSPVPSSARALSIWGWSPSLPGWPSSVPGWSWVSGSNKGESPAPEAAPTSTAQPVVEPTVVEPAVVEPAVVAPASGTSDAPLLADALTADDILRIPEQSGYLRALGLDYGWGPTSVMQWSLESVHVYTGLGWAASIVATALLLRVILLYPQYRAMHFSAAFQRMRGDPRAVKAINLGKTAARDKDLGMQWESRALYKMLKKEYGVSSLGFLWSFMQIPFSYGMFRLINGMASIPVPSMESAGWLWFTDLAHRDPYFILPTTATTLMITSVLINSRNNPAGTNKLLKPLVYIIAFVGLFVTSFLSSAVNLMATTFGAATLATTYLFNNAAVRRNLGLPALGPKPLRPIPKLVYEAPRSPSTTLRGRIADGIGDMKKNFREQLTSFGGSEPEDKAASQRRQMLRRAEEARRQSRSNEFERKYKGVGR